MAREELDQTRADRVAELAKLLRGVVAGTTSRAEVTTFTRELQLRHGGRGSPLSGNAIATVVFDSVLNVEEWLDGEFVLRNSDLEHFVRWLVESGCPIKRTRLPASLGHTLPAMAQELSVPTLRYWVDGLGWVEGCSFASPHTGRSFAAEAPLRPDTGHAVDLLVAEPIGITLMQDLFETLVIDASDLFDPPALPFPRWHLRREDDNGVRALVATFTGRRKAEARLARFEALGHKQSYWLEAAGR